MNASGLFRNLQRELSSTAGAQSLIEGFLRLANEYANSPAGFLYSLDLASNSLIFQLGYRCTATELDPLSVLDSASGQAIQTKKPSMFLDIQNSAPYICKEFARKRGLARYLAVPVLDSTSEVIGVLGLHPSASRSPSGGRNHVLSSIARLIGLTVEAERTREREYLVHHLATLSSILRSGQWSIPEALREIKNFSVADEVYYFPSRNDPSRCQTSGSRSESPQSNAKILRMAVDYVEQRARIAENIPSRGAVRISSTSIQKRNESGEGLLAFLDAADDGRQLALQSLRRESRLLRLTADLFEAFLENQDYLHSVQKEEEKRAALTLSLAHEVLVPIHGLTARIHALRDASRTRFPIAEQQSPPFIYFEDALGALSDLRELTEGILSINEERLNVERCSIHNSILSPVVNLLRQPARRNHITMSIDRANLLSMIPTLSVDKSLITHVFYNLLKNAIKYGYRDTSIKVYPEVSDDAYSIHIENWGIDVVPSERDLIFEPFKRGANAHTKNVRGAGLGLYISRRLMQLHGGRLELTSAGNPTVFTIKFPRSLA